MGTQNVVKFWSSILGESVFVDQLESVMDIEDSDVRTFKLLCKTLFLLVMGKHSQRFYMFIGNLLYVGCQVFGKIWLHSFYEQ